MLRLRILNYISNLFGNSRSYQRMLAGSVSRIKKDWSLALLYDSEMISPQVNLNLVSRWFNLWKGSWTLKPFQFSGLDSNNFSWFCFGKTSTSFYIISQMKCNKSWYKSVSRFVVPEGSACTYSSYPATKTRTFLE